MKGYSHQFSDSVVELGRSYNLSFVKGNTDQKPDLSAYSNEMILEIQFIGEVTGSFLMVAKEEAYREIASVVIEEDDEQLFNSFWLDFLNISIQPALESISKTYRYLTITAPKLYHAPVKFPEFPKQIEVLSWNDHEIHLYTMLDKRVLDTMQAYLHAKEANESKSRFLANISHDIRTPLNAVLGFSQLLEDREMDLESKSYVKKIRKSSISLLELVNDILDLSKIESGKFELNYDAIELKSVFKEMEYMFSLKANNQDLDFKISISRDFPNHIFMDEARLKQVIVNLLSNAFKFTEEGCVKLAASWSVDSNPDQGTFEIIVEDTGKGIPEDQQAKVFSAFEQVQGQDYKKYGGTGLGLAITRRIIDTMGGEIKLSSTPGKGTKFEITVPGVKTARLSKTCIELDPVNKQLEFESAKILVVDDLDMNRKLLRAFLEQYALDVYEAADGYKAIEMSRNEDFDLILLDMKMPGMDGYEVFQTVRKEQTAEKLPIVAVTASALKKEQEMLEEVFEGFLAKPLNRLELLETLKKYLKHKEVEVSEKAKVKAVSKQLLHSLVKKCHSEISPIVSVLKDDPTSVNAMIELGNCISRLADKYPEPQFLKWKLEVEQACDTYDITRVSEMIETYPDFLEKLSGQSKSAT